MISINYIFNPNASLQYIKICFIETLFNICPQYCILSSTTIHSRSLSLTAIQFMSQMNPKEFVHITAYSVQLPYIAGRPLPLNRFKTWCTLGTV